MLIRTTEAELPRILQTIAEAMGVKLQVDCDEYFLEIPEKFGEGTIRGIDFNCGLGLLQLSCVLQEELSLHFDHVGQHRLRMAYCIEGRLTHTFAGKHINYELQALQGSISASTDENNLTLNFLPGPRIRMSTLEINRAEYLEKVECNLAELPKQLAATLSDFNSENAFLYQRDFSIAISEILSEISNTEYSGLARKCFLEGKAHELLAQQIRQFEADTSEPETRAVLIRKSDVERIKQARAIIVENLVDPPKVRELARQVGININKLQQGFKAVFDTTISQFILARRMERAKLLLMEGSLTIGEIAEAIGYSNASHFTRRFKEKFGAVPSDFVKNMKQEVENLH